MKRVLQVLVAVMALLALGNGSRVRYRANPDDVALLRLSWRTRGVAAKQCRKRTEEELEELPAHMRTPEVCEGRVANYRLNVRVDGGPVETLVLRAAGAHADRPIFVFKEIRLQPGNHSVDVDFFSTLHENPPHLKLARTFVVKSGEIAMITTDSDSGQLIMSGK